MIIEIKTPSPGESIPEADVAKWLVNDGDIVEKDQEIGETESDKATLPLIAPDSGKIKILVQAGTTVPIGSVIASIDTSFAPHKEVRSDEDGKGQSDTLFPSSAEKDGHPGSRKPKKIKITPLARQIMHDRHIAIGGIPLNSSGRVTRKDAERMAVASKAQADRPDSTLSRQVQREKMSALRKKLGERLVAVKNETAMLTTFNEVDMSYIIMLRTKYQKAFTEKYHVKLGFMSFFAKAVTEAIKLFPNVNSMIDGDDIVIPQYCDLGIAVQTEKGLMVPVIKNVEMLSIPSLEIKIQGVAQKAHSYRLPLEEMAGGTFTITNGGVFGSLLSTPLLNPPQSAILGMHHITDRPVAVKGKIKVKPMMYLALSYDHRVIDGKESVGFLLKVKELIEQPLRMISEEGTGVNELLLGI